jgi:hypothetical protein
VRPAYGLHPISRAAELPPARHVLWRATISCSPAGSTSSGAYLRYLLLIQRPQPDLAAARWAGGACRQGISWQKGRAGETAMWSLAERTANDAGGNIAPCAPDPLNGSDIIYHRYVDPGRVPDLLGLRIG